MDNSLGPKISAVVMIYNEEAQIRQCLETIKWVDEIVICDSFSTDRTLEICREYTDKIFQHKFDNFGDQKRWLSDKPSHEWVLFVEADERFPKELCAEIRSHLAADEGYDGYWMDYKNFVLGKEMKGKFWATRRIKLYKKDKSGWEDKLVHVSFVLNGKAGRLNNPVLHYPYRSIKVMFDKISRATTLEARQLIQKNAHVSWLETLKAVCWIPMRFYKFFFELEDYKSGLPGLVFSLVTSFYNICVNIKYWKIKICKNSL
jgi:glycosyltransferase involved in cell wall biosynthesis